ncbi:preprotein translocase subunit YajC [Naumannella huperziae]
MNLENLTTLGLIALMVVGFYFLIIRPTRNRQKEQARTLESATVGARVMTASGVIGTVAEVGDRQARIEIAPGVIVTVVKQAIVQVLPDGDGDEFTDVPAVEDPAAEPSGPESIPPASDPVDDQDTGGAKPPADR